MLSMVVLGVRGLAPLVLPIGDECCCCCWNADGVVPEVTTSGASKLRWWSPVHRCEIIKRVNT